MRKLATLLGIGLLSLSGALFYAEQKRASGETSSALGAIQEVLRAQNQALAGRLFEGLGRADRDAAQLYQRWQKTAPKLRSYLADTELAEPDAPKWAVVAGRKIRAAGVIDDALLEDALEAHAAGHDRLALYPAKGKYYLFIKGSVDGQPYAVAYAPEAFFGNFRSADGIRAWLALRDGTVVYHPVNRFIGANAANLKPIATGIAALTKGSSAPYASQYLGLEGHEALGAWTPLPSFGLLVASEWPRLPESTTASSGLFWIALVFGTGGLLALGYSLGSGSRQAAAPMERLFDEGTLDADAAEYLEEVRASAERAVRVAEEQGRVAEEARRAREEALAQTGSLEWRARLLEDYLDRVLPKGGTKQIWEALGALVTFHAPEISVLTYRYSTSSFSLVPEAVHSRADLPASALAFLKDARIFIGKWSLLESLTTTEAFQRWNKNRERHMPLHQTEFRVYSFQGKSPTGADRGAIVLFYDRRLNAAGELEQSLRAIEALVRRTATFCDSFPPLLQSNHAKGSAWPSVAGPSNDARNRPRPT